MDGYSRILEADEFIGIWETVGQVSLGHELGHLEFEALSLHVAQCFRKQEFGPK
jgi:hypothetical protein